MYNALSKQRLNELDESLKMYGNKYDELYKEIESILSGAMDSQLSLLFDVNKK